MRNLLGKVIGVILGIIALFGISAVGVAASVPNNISSKTALYLEHGKSINNNVGTLNYQDDSNLNHVSHSSHASHSSHSSGY